MFLILTQWYWIANTQVLLTLQVSESAFRVENVLELEYLENEVDYRFWQVSKQ